ncbi:hypothetical protein H9P43_000130 [Blastocladiella emersonii ATCC 22665]|nr:hypothetical protein H9P43_000130 [Blastocladiella emersonii ATCC 22665]
MGVLSTLSQLASDALDAHLPSLAGPIKAHAAEAAAYASASPGTTAAAVTAIVAAAMLLRLLWSMRIPRSLRHLPAQSMWQANLMQARQSGFLELTLVQAKAVAKQAFDRGLVPTPEHVRGVYLTWLFGEWVAVLTNPVDFKTALLNQQVFDRIKLDEVGLWLAVEFTGVNVVQAKLQDWKRHRKVVNPAFRRGWPTLTFAAPTRRLFAHFDQLAAGGAEVDIGDWFQRLTLDALTVSAFGLEFNAIDHPDNETVARYNRLMAGMFDPLRVVFPNATLLLPSTRAYRRDLDAFNAFLFGLIDERRKLHAEAAVGAGAGRRRSSLRAFERDEETRDLLDLMLTAQDAAEFSREDLRANLAVFFLAGHDTTANSLTLAVYLLGMHPAVQAAARAEVLAELGDDAATTEPEAAPFPTNDQQARLTYLTHVLQETQRLFPSVGVLPPRRTTAAATLADGTVLPAGTAVTPNVYLLHRSRAVWGDDADEFKPERWAKMSLNDSGSGSASGDGMVGGSAIPMHPAAYDYKWAPFGGGQRFCLGQSFATIQQRTVLAMLLARYEWTTVGDDKALAGYPDTMPGILAHPLGITVQFKRRGQ